MGEQVKFFFFFLHVPMKTQTHLHLGSAVGKHIFRKISFSGKLFLVIECPPVFCRF